MVWFINMENMPRESLITHKEHEDFLIFFFLVLDFFFFLWFCSWCPVSSLGFNQPWTENIQGGTIPVLILLLTLLQRCTLCSAAHAKQRECQLYRSLGMGSVISDGDTALVLPMQDLGFSLLRNPN